MEAPQYQKTTAESAPDELLLYGIQSPNGRHRYPSYVIVVDDGELGQYYDIQGSTWTGLPLLSDPSQSVRIGSRTYSLFYDGEHIKTVAWREGRGIYWIENTLTYSLSPETMVAIARTTRPVGSSSATVPAVSAAPHRLAVALPPPSAAGTSSKAKIEAAIALLSLVIVVLLGLRLLYRQRELKILRAQVAEAMALEARRATRLRARVGVTRRPPLEAAPSSSRSAAGGEPVDVNS